MNTCYIFGSVEVNNVKLKTDSTDLIIAADKGLITLQKFNIEPDLIVGDFDSLEYIPEGKNVFKYPIKKDDTDLIIAIKTGLNKGFKNFEIYGCLGGQRLDHTIATIQSLAFANENSATAVVHSDSSSLTLLENKTINFSDKCEGYVSIFSYTDNAEVSVNNLLYPLSNAVINNTHPLGVSNEFTGKKAFITCHKGKIIVTWNNKKGNFKLGE